MLFCPIPWIHQAIRNNGDFRVCCQGNQGPDRGILRKDDGNPYNAAYDDFDEVRNSKKLKEIRLAMLNNKWHPECVRCETEERNKIRSRFTYEKDLWSNFITKEKAERLTESDGTINTKLFPAVYYDIRFGNLCNLKCRMCGPTDSNQWYSDYVQVWDTKFYDESCGFVDIVKRDGKYIVENDIYNWHESDHFWQQLYSKIPLIRHVQMVGGEPFLIKRHYEFLEKCIEYGRSNKIIMEHNSNITYLPDKLFELWKEFKKIRIGPSIDGLGKVNEYIRYPSKWSVVEKNLRRLDEADGNFEIWITPTIQIYNILQLPEMMQWKLNQNFKRVNQRSRATPFLNPHPLYTPHFLNIQALPQYAKEIIKEKLISSKFTKFNNRGQILLKSYVDFMYEKDLSHELKTFWKYSNKLDELRNQKLQDYIPELYELIGGTDV